MKEKGCQICGGPHFHRLGCPLLERSVFMAATVIGIVTAVITVSWMFGGRRGNIVLGGVLTVFFFVVGLLSRRMRKSRETVK